MTVLVAGTDTPEGAHALIAGRKEAERLGTTLLVPATRYAATVPAVGSIVTTADPIGGHQQHSCSGKRVVECGFGVEAVHVDTIRIAHAVRNLDLGTENTAGSVDLTGDLERVFVRKFVVVVPRHGG